MNDDNKLSIYISADMEGVAGLTVPNDVWEGGNEFERGRFLLTAEVNAAIQGAFDAGATRIVVNDAHMYMTNILVDQLDSRVELIRGSRKRGFMMEGIEKQGFHIAMFVGYHSMAGTQDGVLCHTFTNQIAGLYINDNLIGESTYNALYAGFYGCTVGMVSGDQSLRDELEHNLPWVEHVTVKQGIGRFASIGGSPEIAQRKIYKGAQNAIRRFRSGELQSFTIDLPATLKVRFYFTDRADISLNIPGTRRLDPLTVSFEAKDFETLHKALITIMLMSN